jgi:hypothetical protein
MIKARFINLLKSQLEDLIKLTQTKGEEYARSDDQLANFKRQAAELGMAKEKVLGIFLNKHLDSIKGYIADTEKPMSEPIEGRIDDAILYLVLLKAMVVEKRESDAGSPCG